MDAGHIVVEELGGLLGGVVNARALHGFGVVFRGGAVEGLQELRRVAGASGELCHPLHAGKGGHGHDAGDDRDIDPGQRAAVAEVEEIVVVEE